VRTRILDRRQTEDGIQQNYYLVECCPLSDGDTQLRTSIELVDVGGILNHVSPYELERFENEQFRLEAEAEDVAARVEADELARRRLERNACEPTTSMGRGRGRGRGMRILSGLGAGLEALHMAPRRGRPRGSRGMRRGWRGRGQLALSSRRDDGSTSLDIADGDLIDVLHSEEEILQRVIEQTESEKESDVDEPAQSSPGLMRSAFVANSALPASQTKSPLNIRRQVSASPLISESDVELVEYDTQPTPSAALQFHDKGDLSDRIIPESQADTFTDDLHHRKKRRTKSESATPDLPTFRAPTGSVFEPEGPYTQQLLFRESSIPDGDSISEPEPPQPQDLMFRNQSSIPEYESESLDGDISASSLSQHTHSSTANHDNAMNLDDNTIRVLPPHSPPDVNVQNGAKADEIQAELTEEYVVESIIKHCYKAGRKYYLVKWEGYEDSNDWLPEEDLADAAEVVTEYHQRISSKKGKMKSW